MGVSPHMIQMIHNTSQTHLDGLLAGGGLAGGKALKEVVEDAEHLGGGIWRAVHQLLQLHQQLLADPL